MTNDEKINKISDYGVLAIPAIYDFINSNRGLENLLGNLAEGLENLASSYNLKPEEMSIINNYLNNN